MARNHGKILTRIWRDPDFLDLPPDPQRLYMFLCTQEDLTFAGVVPLRPQKWATKASGLKLPVVQKQVDVLVAKKYVVTDEITGELLVRTFIRNDEVWKLPKVMVRCKEDILLAESPAIWRALLGEIEKIPTHLLKDEAPATGGPTTRKFIESLLDEVKDTLSVRLGLPVGDESR